MDKIALYSVSLLSLLNVVNLFLVVPPTSPTRHQLISGIGIPLQLKDESITMGIVLKAQYFLPETANQLKFNFFPNIWSPYEKDFLWDIKQQPFPNGRKRREIVTDPISGQPYEKYEGKVNQIGDDPLRNDTSFWEREGGGEFDDEEFDDQFVEDIQDKKLLREFFMQQRNENLVEDDVEKSDDLDLSLSRWVAYEALGHMLESKGFNGRMCVLRGICEAAEIQFSLDLMGELFHIFFTPSTTNEPVEKSSDYDYIKAELIGKDNGPACDEIFHQCKKSIMEIFTQIDDNEMFQFQ